MLKLESNINVPVGDECKDVHADVKDFQSLAKLPIASGGFSYQVVALLTLVLPLVGGVVAIWTWWRFGISLLDVGLLIGMYLWAVLGIELGYHRYLTHRALKAGSWLRTLFIVSGCMAGHGQPIWWVAIHRRHHQYSDHHGDPHSPNLHGDDWQGILLGGWHSHIGWMFEPECTAAYATHFTKDLLNDRLIRWIDRWYVMWVLIGLAIPSAIGGVFTQTWYGAWTGFLWGGLVRMFLDQHALWWGIVTICHRFGYRSFQSNDSSTNHWFVAIIFLGDGWHNNHHAFPASAKVGLTWWEYDPTWTVIRIFEKLGLVWDVKVPSKATIEQKRKFS
jgi:stearoyl-CoA desaturase (Delta-9 desaturase)